MNKQTIATTKEQSTRLLRCGVSADTADMCWLTILCPVDDKPWGDPRLSTLPYSEAKDIYGGDYIEPAWSLSALLSDVLPCDISDNEIDYSLFLQRRLSADNTPMWELSYYNLEYDATLLFVEVADPIEACVLMAEKLVANGYKLNEQ